MRRSERTTAIVALGVGLALIALSIGSHAAGHTRHSKAESEPTFAGMNDAGPTKMFIIRTEEDAKKMAELHATAKGELLFTTYSFTHRNSYSYEAINQALHMWANLNETGILNHTIVLSYDVHSCQVMWEHGIPCFLDRWLPQPSELPGQYGSEVPHWYQKYAWALKLIEFGYMATFMELDMVFFESPLPYYNPAHDLEGLSDWHRTDMESAKERFTNPCSVYHMEKGENDDNYLQWGPHDPKNSRSTYHINPCMSTGFWFVQPTKAAREFLAGYMDLMLYWRNNQVDQVLWNEVIMAYLIGYGQQEPLRFSLLDTARFSNFEIYEKRTAAGLPTSPVMLHAGAMKGSEKEPYMRSHGYWKAEAWNPKAAEPHIARLGTHFKRELP